MHETSLGVWTGFVVFILAVLGLDLGVFHKKSHSVSFKEAIVWSVIWITLALAFSVIILYWRGQEDFMLFLTGYVIEKSLSVDNLFVFLLIFFILRVFILIITIKFKCIRADPKCIRADPRDGTADTHYS
jgi:tellurite resistance protein TerC